MRPTEIYVTDQRGRPLDGGAVTVTLDGEQLEVRAGARGRATIQLPDDDAQLVTVHTPAGTMTAPAGMIAGLLGPTPLVHAAAARAALDQLEAMPAGQGPSPAAWTKLVEVVRELIASVED